MNWKTLGKAALVTCGLFGITALIIVIGHVFPWIVVVIAFIAVLWLIYSAMDFDYDSDSDRMQWFSSRENEEEEEND